MNKQKSKDTDDFHKATGLNTSTIDKRPDSTKISEWVKVQDFKEPGDMANYTHSDKETNACVKVYSDAGRDKDGWGDEIYVIKDNKDEMYKAKNIESTSIETKSDEYSVKRYKKMENKNKETKNLENKNLESKDIESKDIENKNLENENLENENREIKDEEIKHKQSNQIENKNEEIKNIENKNQKNENREIKNEETKHKQSNQIENKNIENENREIKDEEIKHKQSNQIENKNIENKNIENKNIENRNIEIKNEAIKTSQNKEHNSIKTIAREPKMHSSRSVIIEAHSTKGEARKSDASRAETEIEKEMRLYEEYLESTKIKERQENKKRTSDVDRNMNVKRAKTEIGSKEEKREEPKSDNLKEWGGSNENKSYANIKDTKSERAPIWSETTRNNPLTFEVLRENVLTRDFLITNVFKPFFSFIKGGFVRLSIGDGYAIVQIEEVVYDDEYMFYCGKMHLRTDKNLKVKHGDDSFNIPITVVSNSPIERSEFDVQRLSRLPGPDKLIKETERIRKLFNRPLTKDEESKAYEERRSLKHDPKKRASYYKLDCYNRFREARKDHKRELTLALHGGLMKMMDNENKLTIKEVNALARKLGLTMPGEVKLYTIIKEFEDGKGAYFD